MLAPEVALKFLAAALLATLLLTAVSTTVKGVVEVELVGFRLASLSIGTATATFSSFFSSMSTAMLHVPRLYLQSRPNFATTP